MLRESLPLAAAEGIHGVAHRGRIEAGERTRFPRRRSVVSTVLLTVAALKHADLAGGHLTAPHVSTVLLTVAALKPFLSPSKIALSHMYPRCCSPWPH